MQGWDFGSELIALCMAVSVGQLGGQVGESGWSRLVALQHFRARQSRLVGVSSGVHFVDC